MIRRLGEQDRGGLLDLLQRAPQMNLYLLGNVDANGFASEFCEFFGDVANGHVLGVVNRYATGWTVFGLEAADWKGLGEVLDHHPTTAERLQDNPGGVPSLLPFVKRYVATSVEEEPLMELPLGGLQFQEAPSGFLVRRASLDDLGMLIDLFADAGDMTRSPASVERPLRDRRIWIVEREGVALAAALTNAETPTRAMIGGVYTRPEWRGLGLSQAVCSALCQELVQSGRQPALYWKNPAAGHVYRKLGFRRIGTWRSLRLALR